MARRATAPARHRLWLLVCALLCLPLDDARAARLRIRSDFGPENAERPARPATRYIVLHTTEGREQGSLRKLRRRGEAHYFVHRDGRVTRLVDRRRVATHAGLSLWDGRSGLDAHSLAIEVSGYHDKRPTAAQYAALRELLRQLQSLYDIPDERVLTHSMVAYGEPNRFHPYPHRGRKRCAMVFADPGVRREVGLTAAPRHDPDVEAGRLRVADGFLQRRLYPPRPAEPPVQPAATQRAESGGEVITRERTAWRIAGRAHASATTLYVFPDGTRLRGDEIRDWGEMPHGTRVVLGQPVSKAPRRAATAATPQAGADPGRATTSGLLLVGQPTAAADLLGGAATDETTSYLLPSGAVYSGAELGADARGEAVLRRLPTGTRVLVGYVNGGRVERGQSPTRLAGSRWNAPSTYYRVPGGSIRTGSEINASRVPAGTLVFFRP